MITDAELFKMLKEEAEKNPDKGKPRIFMMTIEEVDALYKFAHLNEIDRLWAKTTPSIILNTLEVKDADKKGAEFTDITCWDKA